MIEELFKKGYLQYEKMILENAKVLGVTAEEAVVLVYLLKDCSMSFETLHNNLLMSSDKIDKIMSSLMERGFYEIYLSYDNGKGSECISFVPLFNKLEAIITNQNGEVDDYDIAKAIDYLSGKMNRVLSSSELEIIQGWMLEERYKFDDIVSATEKILENKRALTIRTLTVKLAEKKLVVKQEKEPSKELKDFFNKI